MSTPTIFSADQLRTLAIETLPTRAMPGEAVVVGTIDQQGAQVVASFTNQTAFLGGLQWEVQAVARHDWTGDNAASAKVLLRWIP